MYREWVKPRDAQVIEAARRVRPGIPVLYHSDGNIEALIPDFIGVGVTALNPVRPEAMDPAKVQAEYGDRLTIRGAASTQRTIAFGGEADVDAEVKERLERSAPGGGYVVGFINVTPSPRARRNVLRYMMRIHEFGV